MSRNLKKGPRGGVYYTTERGRRVYVDRSSYMGDGSGFITFVLVLVLLAGALLFG
jgi:hypothetical protein